MNEPFQIRIYEEHRLIYQTRELTGPVELGRQQKGEEGPYSLKKEAGQWRLVVAKVEENNVSRQHVRVEPLSARTFRLTNLRKQPIRLADNSELKPDEARELPIPYLLPLGKKTVRVSEAESDDPDLQSLGELTRAPGFGSDAMSRLSSRVIPRPSGIEKAAVFQWLHATMEVIQGASHSTDFFQQAARAAVDIVGLDSCRVLVLDQDQWKTAALTTGPGVGPESNWQPSRSVLSKVRREKKTFWQMPQESALADMVSLACVRTVVAAPILDPKGEVIGSLYGDRHADSGSGARPPITNLEALLVELLASGVAAGLARLEQEKAAVTARVQFEQFFTPELSRQLASNPDMLKGRDLEVTILFCDIRGFSRITERLGPAGTGDWIGHVMGTLSDCVQAQGGVLVDYIGDELMAMWGAPDDQPDHAKRACQAALHMLDELPKMNERWHSLIQETMGLGIGINSGLARVGNTGTHRKFKYGPLGNTVNLASRVQGASKYLKSKLLITGSTQAQLDAGFERRRLAKVRVVNIKEAVDLYELVAARPPNWNVLKEQYEQALGEFEKKQFRSAIRSLGNLLVEFPGDGPSLVLLARAVNALVDEDSEFDPSWELPGK